MADCLAPAEDGVLLTVYVQPRASKNELAGLQDDALKVRLTSPPVEGAANKLCREFFAKLLGVAKGRVELVSGQKSRHKRLLITGINVQQAREKLF